jgi:hypothetical protein
MTPTAPLLPEEAMCGLAGGATHGPTSADTARRPGRCRSDLRYGCQEAPAVS